jgi:S-adenosylmethionine:tRNA ribosyltransferase-isomerase
MRIDDFDFALPEALIALRPVEPRETARLLRVEADGAIDDWRVGDLPSLLRPGDALVINDTKVIPARLRGQRRRGETRIAVEATLHKRLGPDAWSAFMRPGKRLKAGDEVRFDGDLSAEVIAKGEGGEVELRFDRAGDALSAAIEAVGLMPLPPYIAARRPEDERDRTDYQTIYARESGSVAAPTAGLHLTSLILDALKDRGVSVHVVTLHVGAGTFLPVKAETLEAHRMHAEWGIVSRETAEALNAARDAGGRLVCVGTTSLRLIESAAADTGRIRPFCGETDIFITPGYRFRAADGLMTNFHLPRSTLFVLVCAFCGQRTMRRAYAHAIDHGYRFYSYGDASLLWRAAA